MPQYDIITTPVTAGQSSKTIFSLMRSAYLGAKGKNVLVIDFAQSENLYTMLAHLHGVDPERYDGRTIIGYKYFRANDSQLGVVRPYNDENVPTEWGHLLRELNIIQGRCSSFDNIIVETNISPTANGLVNLNYLNNASPTWRWAVMNGAAICEESFYDVMTLYSPDRWLCVHNSLFAHVGRNSRGDMPAMQRCHAIITGHGNMQSPAINRLIAHLDFGAAKGLQSSVSTSNDFWECLYKPILTNGIQKSLPLLPVYRFVNNMMLLTLCRFAGVPSLISFQAFEQFLDSNFDSLYSDVYKPFFAILP